MQTYVLLFNLITIVYIMFLIPKCITEITYGKNFISALKESIKNSIMVYLVLVALISFIYAMYSIEFYYNLISVPAI